MKKKWDKAEGIKNRETWKWEKETKRSKLVDEWDEKKQIYNEGEYSERG